MNSPRLEISIANYLQFFLAGLLLADIFVTDWQDKGGQHWSWDVVGLTVGPLVFCLDTNWFSIMGPFVIFVAYCTVFRGIWLRWLLTRPLLTIPGGMCYSIYLFHFPLMANVLPFSTRLFAHANGYLYFLVQLSAMTIVIGVFCTMFFVFIERPCMNKDWPQQLWSRIQNRNRKRHSSPSIQEAPIHSQEMEAPSLSR